MVYLNTEHSSSSETSDDPVNKLFTQSLERHHSSSVLERVKAEEAWSMDGAWSELGGMRHSQNRVNTRIDSACDSALARTLASRLSRFAASGYDICHEEVALRLVPEYGEPGGDRVRTCALSCSTCYSNTFSFIHSFIHAKSNGAALSMAEGLPSAICAC